MQHKASQLSLPDFQWKTTAKIQLDVRARWQHQSDDWGDTTKVEMWQANNPNARDFRLQTIGPAFQATELFRREDGSYVAPRA